MTLATRLYRQLVAEPESNGDRPASPAASTAASPETSPDTSTVAASHAQGAANQLSTDQTAANFLVFLSGAFLTKTGDAIANPKITLTWLLQSFGAASMTIALLVPVRESLSMLPQLWMAAPVDNARRQHRIWQLGTLLQALSLFAMSGVALLSLGGLDDAAVGGVDSVSRIGLNGVVSGWLMLALLVLFSLARCLCSLVSKSLMGKSMPKRRRGQTTGWSASAAGLATCLIGGLLCALGWFNVNAALVPLGLIMVAGGLWLLATLVYGRLQEHSGSSTGNDMSTDPADSEVRNDKPTVRLFARIRCAFANPDFARFVITRALMMSTALMAPWFLLLGQFNTDTGKQATGFDSGSLTLLGGLLVASGIASLMSGPIWGRLADRSSRQVLITAAAMAAGLGALTITLFQLAPNWFSTMWLVPLLYFTLEVSHQGIRVGRKTYLVDLADDDQRIDYIAVSNSCIGVLLLLSGITTGLLSTALSPDLIIGLLSLMALAGALLGTGLPEVEESDE